MFLRLIRRVLWGLVAVSLVVFALLSTYTISYQYSMHRIHHRRLRELANATQSLQQQQQPGRQQEPKTSPKPLSTMGPKFNQKDLDWINQLVQHVVAERINCSLLFKGDKNETSKAKSITKKHPYKDTPLEAFANATRNCSLYRRARHFTTDVSAEERSFPLAYSIVIHKSVEQFERLLRAIYKPNNYYCVHVDKKSTTDFMQAVKVITDCFHNVFVSSKLEVVVYAGFTRLQADINCMEELRRNFSDWKYVLNMAGSEMPAKTNLEMVQLLKIYNGTNLVGKNMKALNPWRWKNRYETVVEPSGGKITKRNTTNIPPPYHLNITKGSAYVILSRAMVDFIFTDPIAKKFLEWNKSTYSPDEQFWATLNNLELNPHLKTPGGNACPGTSYMERAVLWYSRQCHGRNVRSVCVFGAGDLPWLAERPEFVFNKFDLHTDYISYQCTEELIQTRTSQKTPWDLQVHKDYVLTHNGKNCSKS